jgi:hypothetical protein
MPKNATRNKDKSYKSMLPKCHLARGDTALKSVKTEPTDDGRIAGMGIKSVQGLPRHGWHPSSGNWGDKWPK